jgi:hypothetical protein
MQPRDALVPKKSADALDRLEVIAVPNGPDSSAVEKGLMDGEVEAVAGGLHARPVERALPTADGDAAAARAPEGVVVDSVAEQQQVDPRV